MPDTTQLFAHKIRLETIRMLSDRMFGHLSGSSSIIETLAVLYNEVMRIQPQDPQWSGRDYCVLSKGHAGPALYATLALKGYFPLSELLTINQNGTHLPSHVDRILTKGIDMTAGSLGQGVSVAAGIALALQREEAPNQVFTIVGDGELDEGQCWEAIQFASHNKLSNFTLFVDHNKQQLDGFNDNICSNFCFTEKFRAFGFQSLEIDGHDISAIREAIKTPHPTSPLAIVLDTVKGYEIPFLVGNPKNHHSRFSDDDISQLEAIMHHLEEVIHESEAR